MRNNITSESAGRSNVAGIVNAYHEWPRTCGSRTVHSGGPRTVNNDGSTTRCPSNRGHASSDVVHVDLPAELQAHRTYVLQLHASQHHNIRIRISHISQGSVATQRDV